MNSKGELNTNISKIKFDAKESSWGLSNDINLTTTHFWISDSTQSQMDHIDSVRTKRLLSKFKPNELNLVKPDKDSLRLWVDKVKTRSQLIVISGWSYLELKKNDSSITSVILKSKEKEYELQTINYNRPDLPLFYNRSDITNSAYNASVLKSSLEAGTYKIGVRLRNKPLNIDAIQFSDKTVELKMP
jgi:hypothetical protein